MGRSRVARRYAVASSDEEEDEPADGKTPLRTGHVSNQETGTGKLKPIQRDAGSQLLSSAAKQKSKSQQSPAKSKSGNSKKPEPNGSPGVKLKPIYSFFNTSSQKTTSSEPSTSAAKPSNPAGHALEAIQDDIEDENNSNEVVSKGSSTALAVRKRKIQHNESFDSADAFPTSGSQKFYKTKSGDRVPSLSIVNNDNRPWTEQFAPTDLTDLAVHKRKVGDVRQWLETTMRSKRQKVLVLKGAAGTGKTTTIKLLARDLGIEILEWKNPGQVDTTTEGAASHAVQFADFISRAGRSSGLQFDVDKDKTPVMETPTREDAIETSPKPQLLLVEEFPSTFSRTSNTLNAFRSSILQHLSAPNVTASTPTPIVMIVSETLLSTNTAIADSFTAHRLLGPELSNHSYLNIIEFNAVAPTILLKALQTVVVKEARISGRRKTPGTQVLKHISEAGDIRSAISSLEFLCLRGDDGDTWSSKVAFTEPKKARADASLTKAEEEALKLISNRESTLGIFHSVGKVVYNKRIDPTPGATVPQPPTWLSQYRRPKVPENNIDQLIDELGTDTSTFFAALHENYALSCQGSKPDDTLESLSGCMDNISDSDLLSIDRFSLGTRSFSGSATDSLRQDEMAFQVAVRGLWLSLPFPVNRISPSDGKRGDAHRMFYPTSMRLWKKREEIETSLDLVVSRVMGNDNILSTKAASTGGAGSASGVDTWRRGANFDSQSDENITATPGASLKSMNSAKIELLLERLPYMSSILDSKAPGSATLEQIRKVTRIRDQENLMAQPDETEDNDEDGVERESWTTDRPEIEGGEKSSRMKRGIEKPKPFGVQQLPPVVEEKVESLVLEDDDIMDD